MKIFAMSFILLICLTFTASAQTGKGKTTTPATPIIEDAESVIAKLEQDNNKARVKGDQKTLETIYADDFTGVNARGGTTTKNQIVNFYNKDSTAEIYETDEMEIRVFDKTAVVTGRLKYKFAGDLDWLRYTRVYVFRENRWVIVAEHFCFLDTDDK